MLKIASVNKCSCNNVFRFRTLSTISRNFVNSEGYEIDILILMSQLLLSCYQELSLSLSLSLKASECERNNEKL